MSSDPDAGRRPPVHVVAAVIEDLRGRVLLTRRTANRDFAGLWEFPGGKVEPGETPLDALARELHEELGITIGPARPLIRVPCSVAPRQPSGTPGPHPNPPPQAGEGATAPSRMQREEALPLASPPAERGEADPPSPPPAEQGEAYPASPSPAEQGEACPPSPPPAEQGEAYPPSPPPAERGEVGRGAVLASAPHRKRLLLDVHHLTEWTGRPHGREGQATIWVPRDRLHRYAMPPADRPVVAALSLPPLMLVTPEPDPDALDAFVDQVLDAVHRAPSLVAQPAGPSIPQDEPPYGADTLLVQLRAKALPPAARLALTARLRQHLPATATLVINGDVDAARTAVAGLHLTAGQLASAISRPVPRHRMLGASCHTAEDLARAEALGCDYAVLGPVAPTASHPGAPVLGWPGFAALREQASLPIYAIGGLAPHDLATARAHGAQGIAAIRAFWPAPTP